MKQFILLAVLSVFGVQANVKSIQIGKDIFAKDERKLEYVFEIVRHGARAPMQEDPRFTVETS